MEKFCPPCNAWKPVEAFNKNQSRSDGLQDRCRECGATYLRAYYLTHKEKFVKTDPAKIAAHRDQIWRRNQDPEVRAAKNARDRADYARNPQRYKEGAMRRRARIQGAPVSHFTEKDWRRIVARQDGLCHYCGVRAELTKDHLIPLARGGAHAVGNIVGACVACNCKKRTKTRMEFLVWLKRMGVAA